MKPSSANVPGSTIQSYRLQRISRASSLKKHSQTFYHPDESFKLAAINSVNRGVKFVFPIFRFNDTTFLVGDNLNKLRKEPLEEKDKMYETSHEGLANVRKKYDEMKKQRVKMDEKIYRLKVSLRIYSGINKEIHHL